jgi:hypothetical protein
MKLLNSQWEPTDSVSGSFFRRIRDVHTRLCAILRIVQHTMPHNESAKMSRQLRANRHYDATTETNTTQIPACQSQVQITVSTRSGR